MFWRTLLLVSSFASMMSIVIMIFVVFILQKYDFEKFVFLNEAIDRSTTNVFLNVEFFSFNMLHLA